MTTDAPEKVRPLTPNEIAAICRAEDEGLLVMAVTSLIDRRTEGGVMAPSWPTIRATFERHCELTEMLDALEVPPSADLTPQMHDEDCDHDGDPVGLAMCEMDTAVANAELIATTDDDVAAQIIAAWDKLKFTLNETSAWTADDVIDGGVQDVDIGDQEEQ